MKRLLARLCGLDRELKETRRRMINYGIQAEDRRIAALNAARTVRGAHRRLNLRNTDRAALQADLLQAARNLEKGAQN